MRRNPFDEKTCAASLERRALASAVVTCEGLQRACQHHERGRTPAFERKARRACRSTPRMRAPVWQRGPVESCGDAASFISLEDLLRAQVDRLLFQVLELLRVHVAV